MTRSVPTALLFLLLVTSASPSLAACIEDDMTLCLQDDRFRLRVDWATAAAAGAGKARELTPDSGYFWFFRPGNVELTIKVLDGRSLNGHFWVFYGSLSDVEYTVTVKDTATGWIRRYRNPAGEQTTARDTSAFRDEPLGDLMVVTAHPDDEILLAPLLADVCRERGFRCSLLVMTEGEKGICLLPGGCEPDLPTVRRRELEEAAELLGLDPEIWSLTDGGAGRPDAVRRRWDDESGGHLVQSLRESIAESGAGVVVTFDPRHGSTCHPDHRATGDLVQDAVRGLTAPPRLLLLETRATFSPVDLRLAVPGDDEILSFDANRAASLPEGDGTGWDYLLRNAAIHQSQIAASTITELTEIPLERRRVHLLPSETFTEEDSRYEGICGR